MFKRANEKKENKAPRRTNPALVRTVIGVALIVLAVVGIFLWETVGDKAANYTQVVVFSEDAKEGTIVDTSMLGYISYSTDSLVEGVITDYNDIVGKMTLSYIPKGMQLVEGFFEDPDVFVDEDEMVMTIPVAWVYAFPQSLRAGDEIKIYAVDEYVVANASTAYHEEGIRYNEDYEAELAEKKAEIQERLDNKELTEAEAEYENYVLETDYFTGIKVNKPSSEPVVTCKVKYVKDANNREVIDASTVERYDGSDLIEHIEVIVDEDQFNALTLSRYDGSVFVIGY